MATWNELFLNEEFISALPQPEVYKFIKILEGIFTDRPFTGFNFHGAIFWDALHHNTISNINKAVDVVYETLCVDGMFMVSLLSTKSGRADLRGKEIEKNTFVREDGPEAEIPHHYFDEQGIRDLFRKWKIVSLVDIATTYIEENIHHSINPFPYTKWNIIVQK
ncbi:hypothetical protein [Clostridium tagluense]|uniref:hypothetical protein n=1 Tax=Clostridium tagluense TaxID=360422 RepID=UPI001C6F5C5B|nr:hypothetical protein [Clostridium tagluense]MBW9159016.1 hypothetical protein [Clostridium tagluense]WLC63636.1 hypothetical protein KTC93_12120 [Clostridium tagluense]